MINLGLRLALIVFFVKCWAGVHAEVFVVTSNADSGPGTLREAMQRITVRTKRMRFGLEYRE